MTRPTFRPSALLVVLGFFLLLGTIEAMSFLVALVRAGRPVDPLRILNGTYPSLVMQMALAWPAAWLSSRFRLEPGAWRRRLPIHLLAAVVFATIVVIGTVQIIGWQGNLDGEPVRVVATRFFFATLANQIVLYAMLVGIFHALDYLAESEQRERERARLAVSLTESRLHALRSQLSPHFFFNTLNAISTFALQGWPEQVGDMVGALGELMRASLDDRLPHQVPLRRELELLELYLEIQRVRFADWLRVDEQVDRDALDVLVPSLALQPLVENAIAHGGQDEHHMNVVRIRCRVERETETLAIEITNPSPNGASPPTDGLRIGVGLRNTRERLEQLYPGNHTFTFGLTPQGFTTSIRIPAIRAVPPATTGIPPASAGATP